MKSFPIKGPRLIYITVVTYSAAIVGAAICDVIGDPLLLRIPVYVCAAISGACVGILILSGVRRELDRS